MALLRHRCRPAARWAGILTVALAIHMAPLGLYLHTADGTADAAVVTRYVVLATVPEEDPPAGESAPASLVLRPTLPPVSLAAPPEPPTSHAGQSDLPALSCKPAQTVERACAAALPRSPACVDERDAALDAGPLGPASGSTAAQPASAGSARSIFDRAVDAISRQMAPQTLQLAGKPDYPRACRQGLCRHGQPCEGCSEWRVLAPAEGGKPARIECLRKMDCELQNASIRKFFAESRFPAAGRATVYLIPVRMYVHEE